MSDSYIMKHDGEAERIRRKTSPLLIRHHLDWLGLKSGQSFVDFGCASGEVVREAAAVSGDGDIVGLDGDPNMIAAAREKSDQIGLNNVNYRETRIGGAGSSGLPDDSFDRAWTRFFLEYQPDPLAVIREMIRVVKPGGRVALLDIDGNCVWHYPLPDELQQQLDEVVEDLRGTGFDPFIGSKLKSYAQAAGLTDITETIEPYHHIIGRPDPEVADHWRRKITGLKQNYTVRLFPEKTHMVSFFDDILDFMMNEKTMTWSNLYMIQGTKPA